VWLTLGSRTAKEQNFRKSLQLVYRVFCCHYVLCLQCFDAVGWVAGRASGLEWWSAGIVICLERGADLHMAQLMPLPLTVSCFSKFQIGLTFLVPAHPGSPRKAAVKRVCVCVWSLSCLMPWRCVCRGVSLSILPQYVDVNVHPTKHEVHFLHEDTVIEAIQRAVDSRLLAADASRTYYMQVCTGW